MVDGQNIGEKPLEEFELNAELSTITAKNVLPSRIVDRIGQKLKEKNVKITKVQLTTLIEKILTTLRTYGKYDTMDSKPKEQTQNIPQTQPVPTVTPAVPAPSQPTPATPGKEEQDVKKLLETINHLKEKITVLEKAKPGIPTASPVKTVTTDDILKGPHLSSEGEMFPLLEIHNDPESIIVLMKWLQYLVDKIGKTYLPDVLGYYVDIGWITDDVRLDLLDYSKGITEEAKKPETWKGSPNLPSKDHLQSFVYIQKLKGIQLDDRFVLKLEREMEKMTKSLENCQFKQLY